MDGRAAFVGAATVGTPLSAPKVYQYGFHPHNVCSGTPHISDTVEDVLTDTLDPILYANDDGPAVWTTISKLRQSSIAMP